VHRTTTNVISSGFTGAAAVVAGVADAAAGAAAVAIFQLTSTGGESHSTPSVIPAVFDDPLALATNATVAIGSTRDARTSSLAPRDDSRGASSARADSLVVPKFETDMNVAGDTDSAIRDALDDTDLGNNGGAEPCITTATIRFDGSFATKQESESH
jgi:hypothetical protein